MKEIKRYSDNLSEPHFEGLLIWLNKYNQTLDYFDWCAKRMGRYAKKHGQRNKWPFHIQMKYEFVVQLQEKSKPLAAFTT